MSELNLETILQSIDTSTSENLDQISAKRVTLVRKGLESFVGIGGDGRIHLLIGPSNDKESLKLKPVQLKMLSCGILDWSVDGTKLKSYIDICCTGIADSPAIKPFLSFCEDLLKHIETLESEPSDIVLQVFKRWRRFWSVTEASLPSVEWIKGLTGELSFLDSLIAKHGISSVQTWCGPSGGLHDFVGENIAFEVKASQSHPVTIKVSGLSQLDYSRWESLTVVLYRLEENPHGRSIADLVKSIESRLSNHENSLELFWEKLAVCGYRRDQEYIYSRNRFLISGPEFFCVDEEFPALTKKHFSMPIDLRIFDIKYSIEITGLSPIDQIEIDVKTKKMISGE